MKNLSSAQAHFLPAYMMNSQAMPRILVVDDDPMFGKIMKRAAECFGAHITFVQSAEALSNEHLEDSDVAIIDFDLGALTGLDVIQRLDDKSPLPVVLVSADDRQRGQQWPDSIQQFLIKERGPFAIIHAAFEAHVIARLKNQFQR